MCTVEVPVLVTLEANSTIYDYYEGVPVYIYAPREGGKVLYGNELQTISRKRVAGSTFMGIISPHQDGVVQALASVNVYRLQILVYGFIQSLIPLPRNAKLGSFIKIADNTQVRIISTWYPPHLPHFSRAHEYEQSEMPRSGQLCCGLHITPIIAPSTTNT